MDQDRSLADITTTLAAAAGIDPAEVTPEMSIAGDLDIDSMTMLEVIVALEDQFGLLIPDDEWSRFSPSATSPRTLSGPVRRRLLSDRFRSAANELSAMHLTHPPKGRRHDLP